MNDRVLTPQPLTRRAFAPYGDVIEADEIARDPMNDGRFERFDALATVNTDNGVGTIGIVRGLKATSLPYRFDMVERHPLGSQAFVPLSDFRFVVVVAAPADNVDPGDLKAFVTNGRQGINYHRGTWHMPLIALATGQTFLVIDRGQSHYNVEIRRFDNAITLAEPV